MTELICGIGERISDRIKMSTFRIAHLNKVLKPCLTQILYKFAMQNIPLKCKYEQKNLYSKRLLNDVIYTVK